VGEPSCERSTQGRGQIAVRGDGAQVDVPSRSQIEPVRFYTGLVAYPLRQSRSWRAAHLTFLHFWSQVAYISGYFFERLRHGWAIDPTRSDPSLPENPGAAERTDSGSMRRIA